MKPRVIATCLVLVAACSKDGAKSQPATPEPPKTEATAGAATKPAGSPSRLEVTITENGFEPDDITVAAGKPVTLVFTRKTEDTCAKEVVVQMADGTKIEKQLPLDTPVEIAATFPTAGKLTYACGMDMVKGTIVVQ